MKKKAMRMDTVVGLVNHARRSSRLVLRRTRGRKNIAEHGRYHVWDKGLKAVLIANIDPELWARRLGLIGDGVTVVDDGSVPVLENEEAVAMRFDIVIKAASASRMFSAPAVKEVCDQLIAEGKMTRRKDGCLVCHCTDPASESDIDSVARLREASRKDGLIK
jgi:hypothetical protein